MRYLKILCTLEVRNVLIRENWNIYISLVETDLPRIFVASMTKEQPYFSIP